MNFAEFQTQLQILGLSELVNQYIKAMTGKEMGDFLPVETIAQIHELNEVIRALLIKEIGDDNI